MSLSSEQSCRVSIIIKALNEEKRIAAAIQTALAAVSAIGGEVILADSCSTDRTIEIASQFPIGIVQLAHPEERCCGIGPQLGYQHSKGEFIYILDGDMEMLTGFLETAIEFMAQNPQIAGVGGQVMEMNTESLEYIARMERAAGHMQTGEVDRLDMGGLYRRSAIEQTGYFSNRNLHSYEEFDLGVRLRVKGWCLWRLAIHSVKHYGHDAPAYELLVNRWKSKYINGLGELLKAATHEPHFKLVFLGIRELRIYLALIFWWLFILLAILLVNSGFWVFILLSALFLCPLSVMTFKKRSFSKAIYSIISWHINVAGLIRGYLQNQYDPRANIKSVVFSLQE